MEQAGQRYLHQFPEELLQGGLHLLLDLLAHLVLAVALPPHQVLADLQYSVVQRPDQRQSAPVL